MRKLSIGDLEDIDNLYEKMKNEAGLLAKEKIELNIDFEQKGNLKLLVCKLKENEKYKNHPIDTLNIFYHYVANVIADYIIKFKEPKILEKIIKQECYYFSSQEREVVLQLSMKALNEREGFYLSTNIYQISKKVRIINEIIDYLENYDELIIDGFILFRLKKYIEDLRDAVDSGIEDFLMEKEYDEFIHLLQYFVDIQEPQIQTLHILMDENKNYSLLDGNFKPIQNECLEELSSEFLDGEIEYEDLLISSLITIAPTKIYIHHTEETNNLEIMETIQKVFGDRVQICNGCEACRKKSIAKKE